MKKDPASRKDDNFTSAIAEETESPTKTDDTGGSPTQSPNKLRTKGNQKQQMGTQVVKDPPLLINILYT